MTAQKVAKNQKESNQIALLIVFLISIVASMGAVMFGSIMIGDAFGSHSLAHGIQLIGNAIVIPINLCWGILLFSQE